MRKSKLKTLNVLPKNISALLKILDNNPKDLNANKAIGQYFVSTGEHDKCLKYFSADLLIQPNAENYYNLGVALHQIKKLDDALVMYDECINLDSNFAEAYSNRGAIYRDKYNFTEALTNYLKAIELKPAKLDEYLNFSIVLFNLNKFQDALEICNHAISEGGISERRLLNKSGFFLLIRSTARIWRNKLSLSGISLRETFVCTVTSLKFCSRYPSSLFILSYDGLLGQSGVPNVNLIPVSAH